MCKSLKTLTKFIAFPIRKLLVFLSFSFIYFRFCFFHFDDTLYCLYTEVSESELNLALYVAGRYLGDKDVEFAEHLKDDIDNFNEKLREQNCVLVFPPFVGKYRFLAHKIVDDYFFPELCSFSIGQGEQRRTLVGDTELTAKCSLPFKCVHKKVSYIFDEEKETDCICSARFKSMGIPDKKINLSKSEAEKYETMKDYKSCHTANKKVSTSDKQITLKDRNKRPDKLLYVPRALRASRGIFKEDPEKECVNKGNFSKQQEVYSSTEVPCNLDKKIYESKLSEFDVNRCSEFNESSSSNLSSNLNESLPSELIEETRSNFKFSKIEQLPLSKEKNIVEVNYIQCSDQKSLSGSDNDFKDDSNAGVSKSCNTLHIEETIITDSIQTSATIKEDLTSEPTLNLNLDANLNDENTPLKNTDLNQDNMEKTIPEEPIKLESNNDNKEDTKSNVKYAAGSQSEDLDGETQKDSWEKIFNDDGECLDPLFVKELHKVTGHIKVHVAKNNYTDFQPVSDVYSEEHDNILEMWNFPVEFKTQDLVSSLSMFKQESYTIKWVDDCHALAIFSSSMLANQALQMNHQVVKFRPLSEATKESRSKARWVVRHDGPSKPRPSTSAVLARRLVSGALGLKVKTTKEQRELERNMLKEAKEQKKLKEKQKQDVWEGNV